AAPRADGRSGRVAGELRGVVRERGVSGGSPGGVLGGLRAPGGSTRGGRRAVAGRPAAAAVSPPRVDGETGPGRQFLFVGVFGVIPARAAAWCGQPVRARGNGPLLSHGAPPGGKVSGRACRRKNALP